MQLPIKGCTHLTESGYLKPAYKSAEHAYKALLRAKRLNPHRRLGIFQCPGTGARTCTKYHIGRLARRQSDIWIKLVDQEKFKLLQRQHNVHVLIGVGVVIVLAAGTYFTIKYVKARKAKKSSG